MAKRASAARRTASSASAPTSAPLSAACAGLGVVPGDPQAVGQGGAVGRHEVAEASVPAQIMPTDFRWAFG
jgi:hypothetical protein